MADIVEQAHAYLAANAAESGADVLIAELAEEIERLRKATNPQAIERAIFCVGHTRAGPCEPECGCVLSYDAVIELAQTAA